MRELISTGVIAPRQNTFMYLTACSCVCEMDVKDNDGSVYLN